jgi:hypothetical protein
LPSSDRFWYSRRSLAVLHGSQAGTLDASLDASLDHEGNALMTSPAKETAQLELECFLEIEGVSAAHAEEVALALAEEVDEWVAAGKADEQGEADSAREVSKQLRLLGWLINAELGGDRQKMLAELELLTARVNDLLLPPVVSGVRRKFTPPAGMQLAALFGADDEEQTIVKTSKWHLSRNTNRALSGRPGSDPPPSGGNS